MGKMRCSYVPIVIQVVRADSLETWDFCRTSVCVPECELLLFQMPRETCTMTISLCACVSESGGASETGIWRAESFIPAQMIVEGFHKCHVILR